MSKKESLQKRIDNLENKIKYYRAVILTIASGIVWSVYAIMENKADNKIIILSAVGIVIFIFAVIKIKNYESYVDELIEMLEKE